MSVQQAKEKGRKTGPQATRYSQQRATGKADPVAERFLTATTEDFRRQEADTGSNGQ